MRRVLVATSGRADASPLRPVVAALRARSFDVAEVENVDCKARFAGYDCMLLLGDRHETLAAALAATVSGIPIAHVHGG